MGQTVAEIVTEIIQDTHKPGISNDTIVNYLNDGLAELLAEGHFQFRNIAHHSSLAYATGAYRAEVPSGFLDFEDKKAIYDETNERFLTLKEWEEFQRDQSYVIPNTTAPSSTDYAEPDSCSIHTEFDTTQKKYLYIDPPTDADIILRIRYFRQPTEIDYDTHSGTDLRALWGVTRTFITAVKNYAVLRVHRYKRSDSEVINVAFRDYATSKNVVLRSSDKDSALSKKPTINLMGPTTRVRR